MKKLLYVSLLFVTNSSFGQMCNATVYPNVPGSYTHVYSDTTVNDPNGSAYYICGGATLTVTYSAGCAYHLEDGASLIINDHEGDAVFAKGNCSILDLDGDSEIVVNMEATSSASKPNYPFGLIIFTCSPMVFDYSGVGGSSPCLAAIGENEAQNSLSLYPNPVESNGQLNLGVSVESVFIYDISGQLHAAFEDHGSDTVQLGELNKGVYLVVVRTASGQQLTSRIAVK